MNFKEYFTPNSMDSKLKKKAKPYTKVLNEHRLTFSATIFEYFNPLE